MMRGNLFSIIKNKLSKITDTDLVLFFLTATILVLATTGLQIYNRFTVNPNIYIHDGAMQTEEAVKFLINGKNPYTENYFGTPLEFRGLQRETNDINPALYHMVYLPFNIIFSIPFYMTSVFFLGWFDERLVYVFIFLSFIALILKWKNKTLKRKLIFLTFFAINPLFFIFFNEGRNDIFVFFWITLAIYFLNQKRNGLSSLSLAFAITSKHSAWLILPFYFAYLFFKENHELILWQKFNHIFKKTYIFFITAAAVIIPFLIWDFNSFIDDILKYPNGSAFMSYPIAGFGFSEIIFRMKIISSVTDYWPFWIPQLIVGLPMTYLMLKNQKENNTPAQMLFNFSLLLTIFGIFSRYFNDNHIGLILMFLAFAIFLNKSDYSKSTKFDTNTP